MRKRYWYVVRNWTTVGDGINTQHTQGVVILDGQHPMDWMVGKDGVLVWWTEISKAEAERARTRAEAKR